MTENPRQEKKKSKIVASPSDPPIVFKWADSEHAFLATISSGLEDIGCAEIRRKLNPSNIFSRRGKIVFSTVEHPSKVLQLRSIDSVYALLDYRPTPTGPFDEVETPAKCLSLLCNSEWNWESALKTWTILNPRENSSEEPIKFRATCKRGGQLTKQFGESPAIAASLGSHVYYKYSWKIDLVNYDIDVYLHLNDVDLVAGIMLGSPGQRKKKSGRGLLKPPVAFCMAEIANIVDGEIVLDPMCGTAMILVEASEEKPLATYLGCDINPKQIESAKLNIVKYNIRHNCDIFQGDATDLPFHNASIDKIVSDIPFGKRHGKRFDNRTLYPVLFKEWGRITKPEGLCVILTTNTKIMTNILMTQAKVWEMISKHFVNLGGLEAFVYKLRRKSEVGTTN